MQKYSLKKKYTPPAFYINKLSTRSPDIIPTLIRGIIIVGLVWSDGQNFMHLIIFATLVASDITDSVVILLFTYFTAAEIQAELWGCTVRILDARRHHHDAGQQLQCRTCFICRITATLQHKYIILQCRVRARPQCPLNCSDKSADWLLL